MTARSFSLAFARVFPLPRAATQRMLAAPPTNLHCACLPLFPRWKQASFSSVSSVPAPPSNPYGPVFLLALSAEEGRGVWVRTWSLGALSTTDAIQDLLGHRPFGNAAGPGDGM